MPQLVIKGDLFRLKGGGWCRLRDRWNRWLLLLRRRRWCSFRRRLFGRLGRGRSGGLGHRLGNRSGLRRLRLVSLGTVGGSFCRLLLLSRFFFRLGRRRFSWWCWFDVILLRRDRNGSYRFSRWRRGRFRRLLRRRFCSRRFVLPQLVGQRGTTAGSPLVVAHAARRVCV